MRGGLFHPEPADVSRLVDAADDTLFQRILATFHKTWLACSTKEVSVPSQKHWRLAGVFCDSTDTAFLLHASQVL